MSVSTIIGSFCIFDRVNFLTLVASVVGKLNAQYAKFFISDSYLEPLSKKVGLANVTFKPGTRNNWHIHHAKENGGQLLICIGGQGIYKEWGNQQFY